MWDTSVSMLPYRLDVPGAAGRMLDFHSGEVMRMCQGAVVIMAPQSWTD